MIKASAGTIKTAIELVEHIKNLFFKGTVYQVNRMNIISRVDEYEPLIEGLEYVFDEV